MQIDSNPTSDEAHVEVTVPTPDPVPPVIEQPAEEIVKHEHDRLGRLEQRLDQLVTGTIPTFVTREEHRAAIDGRAPADHTHDDRYLTLEQWDRETEPVDVDEGHEEEPAVVMPLPEAEELIEERREEEKKKGLGLTW